jgi:signal peptidase I
MLAFYLTSLMGVALLVISYRYASAADTAPQWFKAFPVPAWGDFFVYAGLMATSALGILTFVMQLMLIPSASMEPGLMTGSKILVKPAAFGAVNPFTGSHITDGNFSDLKRGDVVIAKFAYNADVRYIKRVVALPGDTIAVNTTGITLNGEFLAFEPTGESMIYRVTLGEHEYRVMIDPDKDFLEQPKVTVPANQVFMLGDNLTKSSDSRDLGFIPMHNIIARPY